MGLRRALLVLLIANAVAASPALPQLLGDRVEANCSFVAEAGSVDNGGADNGTVAVICGLPPEQVAGLVKLAASPSAGDRAVLLVRLHAIVPRDSRFPVETVARFLEILHEQPIDEAKLADRFARIAREHGRLVQEIRAFPVADPEVQALRDAAAAALQGAPDHDRARAELEEARHLVRAKRAAGIAASMPVDQAREEADLVRAEARVETARLRFAEAARLHEQAARLLPAEDRAGRAADWESAGLRWTDQGRGFGDDPALVNAIAAFQAALEEQTRAQAPLPWARTQLNLANAFYFLGEREPGRVASRRRWWPTVWRCRRRPANGCRTTGRPPRRTSLPRWRRWASASRGRVVWRSWRWPTGWRCRKEPASGRRWTGRARK